MLIDSSIVLQIILFAATLWLGGYLLSLPSEKPSLILTGWGTLSYSLILALRLFSRGLNQGLWILPAIFWLGAALHLWTPDQRRRSAAVTSWQLAAIPLLILALLEPWVALLPITALLVVTGLMARRLVSEGSSKALPLISLVSLFLTLSTGLMILPITWLASIWGMALLGVDLVLLALALVWWDALEEGQRLREPLLRSFAASMYFAGALAALVLIGIALDGAMTEGSKFVLVAVVAFGVLAQVFSNQIQRALDWLTFSGNRDLADKRHLLRATADNLPKVASLEGVEVQGEKFDRLTRQALRDLTDLSRLSASPLTELPMIVEQAGDNPLERAHQLKALLVSSVERLKPRTEEEFGVTDEWRYYNALYFPYVVGVSPYSRPTSPEQLSQATRQALEWFRREVPERTLYNWQATAAELVADDLRSRMRNYSGWQ